MTSEFGIFSLPCVRVFW